MYFPLIIILLKTGSAPVDYLKYLAWQQPERERGLSCDLFVSASDWLKSCQLAIPPSVGD